MRRGKNRALSQHKRDTEALRNIFRIASDLFRHIGAGAITPDDAATRLQAVMEDRAPDAPPDSARAGTGDSVEDSDDPDTNSASWNAMQQIVLSSVEREIQCGNVEGAVHRCAQWLQDNPRDVCMLLRLGGLQSELGRVRDATDTYLRLATFYVEQGFYLKAVAVYKQVLHIGEDNPVVHARLADLYHQLGLVQDAEAQYVLLAASHERDGQIVECLAVRRKIVELDPQNIHSCMALAETYSRHGRTAAAAQEFQHVADVLQQQHRTDYWLKVAERLVRHDPNRSSVMLELARIYLKKGHAKRALKKLQALFKTDPSNTEVLKLLAAAFTNLQQPVHAALVLRELSNAYTIQGKTAERETTQTRLHMVPSNIAERVASSGIAQEAGGLAAGSPAHAPDRSATFLQYFQALAGPSLDGPREALEGLAACHEWRDEHGKAIEVYDALLRRLTGTASPDADAVQRKIATLRDVASNRPHPQYDAEQDVSRIRRLTIEIQTYEKYGLTERADTCRAELVALEKKHKT